MQNGYISPQDKLSIAQMINGDTFQKFMSMITFDIETEILTAFNETTLCLADHQTLHNLNRSLISLNNRVDIMGNYTDADMVVELTTDGGE